MRRAVAALTVALAASPATAAAPAAKLAAVAINANLAGVVLIAKGNRILIEQGFGTVDPAGGTPHRADARWRLASITKQVIATDVMRRVMRGQETLDRPRPGLMLQEPAQGPYPTVRQLLTHHTGFADPDTTPAGADGVPSFYLKPGPDSDFCASKPFVPDSPFHYNNCDYIIADNMFITVGAPDKPSLGQMTFARAGDVLVPGFVGGKPEPKFSLPSFGAAGALTGRARDVFRFDRKLMTGKLLSKRWLDEMWRSDPKQGYQAIGQWVFPGKLKGCAAPKRIVQRDGEIWGVQTRNFILPDDDIVVIVFTNRSSEDFQFGEVWQAKGFAYDLLSAAACP